MKTVELIRSEGTGVYHLPEGVAVDQVVDIYRNGQQVPLGRFKAVDGGFDIFDSNLSDPAEKVTVDIKE